MAIKRFGKSAKEHTQEQLLQMLIGMESGVKRMEADAKLLVGVDTGDLRRDINSKVSIRGDKIIGTVGSGLDYAFFHSLQNPYLETAVDRNLEYLKKSLKGG